MKYFNYKGFWTREHVRSLVNALILLALATIFQFYASAYIDRTPGNPAVDLFLGFLPIVNLNLLIVEGALAAIVFSIIFVLAKPQYLLFVLKAGAIFIATRAMFIAVTHIGIYPGQINPDTGFFDRIYTGLGLEAGFFFSGHTGLPFLMALILWNKKFWRYAYIVLSIVFGIAVLFAHIHYTMDVLAAPYMTYGIFKMSQYFFAEDWKLVEAT